MASGTVTEVRLYTEGLSGVLATSGTGFTIDGGAVIELADGAKVTLNGATSTLATIASTMNAKARVTWDIEEGKAAKVQGYAFASETPTAVIGISESDGAYQFSVVTGTIEESSKDAVVIRDGAAAKLSDIALGDKICFASNGEYIEATSDTRLPNWTAM